MVEKNIEIIKEQHPCFSNQAHFKYGRIHLPVAPKCNIKCGYCERALNKDEDRPGVAEEIISPSSVLKRVSAALEIWPEIRVAAVAGPGDPLANDETFEALEIVSCSFPNLMKCLSTNGLALCEKAFLLEKLGVNTVTVTVNAVDCHVGAKVYEYVRLNGKSHFGEEAARILIDRQQEGVREVVSRGMVVKINTVYVPHVNGDHMEEIAKCYAKLGANIMNIIPLIPLGRFAGGRPPTCGELILARQSCAKHIEQFEMCKQCRADACGIPGVDDGTIASACASK